MGKLLGSKYSARESGRIGFGDHCAKDAAILKRVVRVGTESDRKKLCEIESDPKHIEGVLKELGPGS